jgi:hypothetical protein
LIAKTLQWHHNEAEIELEATEEGERRNGKMKSFNGDEINFTFM